MDPLPLIDPLLAPLLEMGSTGALVAAVLTAFKLYESKAAKRNGGTVYSRITLLEKEVEDLKDSVGEMGGKLDAFHTDFRAFREEVRLHLVRQATREETLREVRNATGD